METLYQRFNSSIREQLRQELKLDNIMATPTLKKITLNMGVGAALNDKKILEHAISDMQLISGQKPIATNARISVASFKVREGWAVGCKVTLRNKMMWDFFERLVDIAIPRIRDFRGLNSRAFDGRGNYNMGVREQIIFPEIDYDRIDTIRGLDIAITTTTDSNTAALALLKSLKFPFRLN